MERRRGGAAGLVVRSVAVGVATLAGAWFATSFTASTVLAASQPDHALALWRTGAAQAVAAAYVTARPATAPALARAERLARLALGRSPVDATAARALALAMAQQRRMDEGRRLIGYAETLSRRDVPTQMWLIEDRVQAGDVAGSLRHYNRVLLTLPEMRAVLLPVLAAATDQPAVTRALVPMLYPRPEWWSDFLGRYLEVARSPSAVLAINDALRLDPASDIDRYRIGTVIDKLIALGDVAAARRVYAVAAHGPATASQPVVDGDFERPTGLPLDWRLVDEQGHAGVLEHRDGADGHAALSIVGGDGHEVARQLVALAPGRYLLRAVIGMVPAGAVSPPTVTVVCADASSALVGAAPFPVAGRRGLLSVPLTIPAGCTTQWIILGAASSAATEQAPWIDDVAIARAS